MLIFHAAKIYETAMETSRILNEIPAENMVPEVRYFREYLTTNRMALTGRGFFALTKKLMLTVRYFLFQKAINGNTFHFNTVDRNFGDLSTCFDPVLRSGHKNWQLYRLHNLNV